MGVFGVLVLLLAAAVLAYAFGVALLDDPGREEGPRWTPTS